MAGNKKKRKLHERLYRANVLPDGNLNSISTIDAIKARLEEPDLKDTEKEKGSV